MTARKRDLTLPTADPRCGTPQGYSAHQNRKEFGCDPCKLALAEYSKIRYHSKHEHFRKLHRKSYEKNWDQRQIDAREWQAANPEKVREASIKSNHKRRAQKNSTNHEPYTIDELITTYGTICHLCGGEIDFNAPRRAGVEGWEFGLHIDHVMPLSKGGDDTLLNVRPAHGQCNLAKSARVPSSIPTTAVLSDN
jgi:hypothetical protein